MSCKWTIFLAYARRYALNCKRRRTEVVRQLLLSSGPYSYLGGNAHWIHRNIICYSFLWAVFAKGVTDRVRQNERERASPLKNGWRQRLWRAYNADKIREGLVSGDTTMSQFGNPLAMIDSLYGHLGYLYNDMQCQHLTVRVPCCEKYRQQEDEIVIVQNFEGMADNKQWDLVHLPVRVPDPTNLLSSHEPYASGIVT